MLDLIPRLLAVLSPPSNAVTEGASPKVTIPFLVLLVIGVAVTIVGAVSGDGAVLAAGLAIIGSAIPAAAAGAAASPGSVVVGAPVVEEASDDLLSDEARAQLGAAPVEPTPPERRAAG